MFCNEDERKKKSTVVWSRSKVCCQWIVDEKVCNLLKFESVKGGVLDI